MKQVNIATGQSLSRRSFLKGVGVSLALPWLEAMVPAFSSAQTPTPGPRRFVAMHYGLGFHAPFLLPEAAGRDYRLTPYLETLQDYRNEFTVFSGISHPEQRGANGHSSEMTWLTGARHPGLPGFRNTVSLDQVMAQRLGHHTRFPYLALSVNGRDSVSWTPNGVNLPGQSSPSALFRQLFVDGNEEEVRNQINELERGQSILDTINSEAKKLNNELGPRDRDRLDQYLSSVRDLEIRLQQSQNWANTPRPQVDAQPPVDIPDRTDIFARTRLMHDVMLLALQTDSTRIITYKAGGMNAVPRIEGVENDWHQLSHHGRDPEKINELRIIELAEFREISRFFSLLRDVREGDATLLDRTTVLLGSNLGNASSHDATNLPLILAGGGFRHGQHLVFDRQSNTPFCNLFVSVLQRMGIEAERFGTSTGALRGLEMV